MQPTAFTVTAQAADRSASDTDDFCAATES
jgi:hypothetical protein